MEEIRLNEGFVLLKEIKIENVTKSGIYIIPAKWNRKFLVIDSASELVNKNDTVLVEIGKGTEIKLNNEDYLIYHEENIMTTIEL